MPSVVDVEGFDSDAFDETEYLKIQLIAGLSSGVQTRALADALIPRARSYARAIIHYWDTKIGDGTVAVKGGSRGVDYSKERDKLEATKEMRLLLGLAVTDTTTGGGVGPTPGHSLAWNVPVF